MEDGKTVAKPETDPAKNGYDFGGWQNGDAEYDFSAAVKSDLALTAKWTAHAYTITYELNGGTDSSDNPDKYTIESEDITLKDPTGPAAAPVFQGWYSDKDFQNRVSPAVIAKGSTGDRTFYARFGTEALKEFTVTFNVVAEAGGAVLGSDSVKVNDGDKISDAQLEAAKGKIASLGEYEYDGLYTDAALAAAFDTSTKITADTTLYVKVKAVQKFTVTFDSDGGSAVAAVTVKSGDKVTKPADPAKDGYTFKGWLLGDAEYNFETPVTGDITLKAKWETKTVEPTVEKLASTWVPGTSYTGTVEYEMVENGKYKNATASNVMFNIDVTRLALKEKDSITVEFKVTECDGTISQIGYQSSIDSWVWHSVNAKELGSTYKISFKVDTTTSFENNLVDIKFVPQDSDGALIGKKLTIKIEGLKVTHVPYVDGADYTIFETAQTESGNVFGFAITADKFTEYLKDYNTIIFTLKNGSAEARDGWGVLSLISQETSGGWTWHNLKDNAELGTNSYGQLSLSSFSSGAEETVEVDLQKLADAVKAEGDTNQLALQTSNEALLLKISLIKR